MQVAEVGQALAQVLRVLESLGQRADHLLAMAADLLGPGVQVEVRKVRLGRWVHHEQPVGRKGGAGRIRERMEAGWGVLGAPSSSSPPSSRAYLARTSAPISSWWEHTFSQVDWSTSQSSAVSSMAADGVSAGRSRKWQQGCRHDFYRPGLGAQPPMVWAATPELPI